MNKYQYPIMSTYESRMNSMPIFISFCRTGTHLLKFLLENCFDTHGLSSGVQRKYNSYMWFHEHDIHCLMPIFNKVLYLYRNPVEVISSFVYVEKRKELNKNYSIKEIMIVLTNLYKKQLEKYLINYPNEVVSIRYERLLKGYDEFQIACNYFDVNIDKQEFNNVYSIATKEKVIENVNHSTGFYGKFLLSDEYAEYKINFKKKYTNIINDIIFENNKFSQFFK